MQLTELVLEEKPSEEAKKKAEHMAKYDDMLKGETNGN